jgi:hypothetical protein
MRLAAISISISRALIDNKCLKVLIIFLNNFNDKRSAGP